ncbi:serine/threonine-protein kinase [Dactylosporangium salmoneum]|uniref:serine/threonine-protein kinase n=1 Tax=Dactylosporangium salmoneum TaxID=53361 RepID=UPI003CD06856
MTSSAWFGLCTAQHAQQVFGGYPAQFLIFGGEDFGCPFGEFALHTRARLFPEIEFPHVAPGARRRRFRVAPRPITIANVVIFVDTDGRQWSFDAADRIGERSGMGEVFRGSGPGGQPVAIKRIRPGGYGEGPERRRMREVEIGHLLMRAARDGRPTDRLVVPITHVLAGDDLMIVMPLADESLHAALRGRAMDLAAGLRVVREVVVGLGQLHALPVLHRDLKTPNVLRYGEQWRLADFGIARNMDESAGTFTFTLPGTAPYMAPEIWDGQEATNQTDLYALGVLAYEVFAGARPFAGPREPEYRRQHREDPAPRPAGVPDALARLMLRLLRKPPSGRPQDAADVLETLDGIAEHERLPVGPTAMIAAATGLEDRVTRDDAREAAAAEATRAAARRAEQAEGDLRALLEDAHERIRRTLPDARLDLQAKTLSLGPARLTFATQEAFSLSCNTDPGQPQTVRVGNAQSGRVSHAVLQCEAGDDGRLRWRYARDIMDTDWRPLTAAAVLGLFTRALDGHQR